MRLKNYNEDLVLETVKLVLKDRKDVRTSRTFLLDVAAFALNRIPPKYITSERGFMHSYIPDGAGSGEQERLIDAIQLIAIVNRGIDMVALRRTAVARPRARNGNGEPLDLEDITLTYFYNMPHIFGRVVDAENGAPVSPAEATLSVNDAVASAAEPGWSNPYRTSEQTKGYFTFWPKAESGGQEELKASLRISLSSKGYQPITVRRSMKVPGEFLAYDYIRPDRVLDIGTVRLRRAAD